MSDITRKILWIDDEKEIVDTMSEVMRGEGYEVDGANDGVEGLEKIRFNHPDLIVLDMNMPKMSGMEVYHKIYNADKKKPLFPVLAVTARGDLEELFRELNVSGYMTKPFDMTALIDEIHLIMEKIYGASPRVSVPEKEAESAEQAPAVEGIKTKAVRRTNRIILVDENAQSLGQFVTLFSNYDYDVVIASSASGALNDVLRNSADAVIINRVLPDMCGDELVFKLKQMPRTMDIPVVLYLEEEPETDLEEEIKKITGYQVPVLSKNPVTLFNECNRMLQELKRSSS